MNSKYKISNKNIHYENSFPVNNNSNSYINSPFIIEGEFLEKKPKIKSKYLLDNFNYLTDLKNNPIIIGKGGYGKLYLAKNVIDGKEYAIKNISKKKIKEVKVDASIIQREIDIHIRITHPHIIKLFSYLENRNNFYLAMEYAQNGTLYNLIQEKKGLSEKEAFHYFMQVVSAIHFLHIHGYAHRDIKPENILLDKNNQVKLCDFGWCVNVSKGERITFCGTYEYMAPEMINDEFYDMSIDIWSLGVLLYEMLHGYSPFRAHFFLKDAKNAMKEIFRNIKKNNYTIDREISSECVDLIHKLLTKDQKKRIKINEIFLHPWVINKEKEYFPFYKRTNTKQEIKNDIDEDINKEDIYLKIDNNANNNYKNDNNLKNKIHINDNKMNFLCSYDIGNSINNGIYFINEKKMNNYNTEEIKKNDIKKQSKALIKRINEEKYKIYKNEFNSFSQEKDKKNYNSQNNFIYSINQTKNKNNENIKINSNISSLRNKAKDKNEKIQLENISIKKMNSDEINDFNLLDTEKKKSHLNINLIKEIRDIKKIEKSNNINKKETFSFVYNKPRKETGSYVIKNLSKEKKYTENNKNSDIRCKSVEQSLNQKSLNFSGNIIIKNLFKEKEREKDNEINKILSDKKLNYNSNQNQDLQFDDTNSNNKDDFHRFRKKYVHIKKRSFLNENNFKFREKNENNNNNIIYQLTNMKPEKSVQNIYYNTFYNCQFDNSANNTIHMDNMKINSNNNNVTYNNNFYIKMNNIRNKNPIKKCNTDFKDPQRMKSSLSQNNFFKHKSNEIIEDKNKPNDLINYFTEKKIGKIYTNRINVMRNENSGEKNKNIYIIKKTDRKRYLNMKKISPYKRKEFMIYSYN